MVQTFLGYEVLQERLARMGVLELKIENTSQCIQSIGKVFRDGISKVEIWPNIAMVSFWYGDADGDNNTFTVKEGEEDVVVYDWGMMTVEETSEFYRKRKAFAKERGYV